MKRSYSMSVLERLISDAAENGYDIIPVSEGVLGLGHLFLIAPKEGYWSFEIEERPANEWGSIHSLRRFTKISKKVRAMMNAKGE